jgi:hypothetical protein
MSGENKQLRLGSNLRREACALAIATSLIKRDDELRDPVEYAEFAADFVDEFEAALYPEEEATIHPINGDRDD